MTDDDRAYYRVRYAYAIQKAAETGDAGAKSAHLTMAAEYRQLAGLDDAGGTAMGVAPDQAELAHNGT